MSSRVGAVREAVLTPTNGQRIVVAAVKHWCLADKGLRKVGGATDSTRNNNNTHSNNNNINNNISGRYSVKSLVLSSYL